MCTKNDQFTTATNYSIKAKPNETKAWLRGLLHHPVKKRVSPILQHMENIG